MPLPSGTKVLRTRQTVLSDDLIEGGTRIRETPDVRSVTVRTIKGLMAQTEWYSE